MTNISENKKSAHMTREMQMQILSVFTHIKDRQTEVSAQMPEKWTISVENATNFKSPPQSMRDDSLILTVKRENDVILKCAKSPQTDGPDSIYMRTFIEGGVQRQLEAVVNKVVESARLDQTIVQDMIEKRIEEIDSIIDELRPSA